MAKEDGLGPEVSVLSCNTNLEVQRNIFCGLFLLSRSEFLAERDEETKYTLRSLLCLALQKHPKLGR